CASFLLYAMDYW
nr:immunoglobulin heavy chain junction region [Mus musculus]